MTTPAADFDSPWKEVLERYLPEFCLFFFPEAHAGIDWVRGYTFLDKELQQVTRDAELGRRLADKLVQVWRNDGDEAWVLVHIEVQSQEEAAFARRMFGYYYRLLDRYDRQVVSLAVLGDERVNWRPTQFSSGLWGCDVQFRFPVVKLLDYRSRWAELEASPNPFATVVMAHLQTLATRGDAISRSQAKLALTRRLYGLGYSREQIIDLFKFIDWLLRLPEALEDQFWQEMRQYEEEQRMAYITSVERIGIRKGLEQGLRQGLLAAIELGLELRFGETGLRLLPEIREIEDLSVIERIYDQIKTAPSLDALRRIYMPPAAE